VDDQGNPVPNVTWTLLGPNQEKISSGSTADDGQVGTRVPDPGTHTLQFDLELGAGTQDGPQADVADENYGV
jgi:hypothetical protein